MKNNDYNNKLPIALNLVFYILLFSLISGCAATMNYEPSIVRFDSPETSGEYMATDIDVSSSYTSSRRMAIVSEKGFSDARQGSPDWVESNNGRRTTNVTLSPGLRAGIGMAKWMDIYYRTALLDEANIVGAKLQLFGTSQKENKAGLKVALSMGIGYGQEDYTGSFKGQFNLSMNEVALNIGYRLDQQWIAYLNNFYSRYQLNGELGKSTDSESYYLIRTPTYMVDGDSKGFGQLLGVRYEFNNQITKKTGRRQFVSLEIGRGSWGWPQVTATGYDPILNENPDKAAWAIGVSSGFVWD